MSEMANCRNCGTGVGKNILECPECHIDFPGYSNRTIKNAETFGKVSTAIFFGLAIVGVLIILVMLAG